MIRINLLPGKKKPLILPSALIYGIIATLLLIIIAVVSSMYLNKKVSAMQNDILIKEKRINELKIQLKEVENYEKDNEEFRKKTEIIEQLKNNQVAPVRLLDQVSEMLPKGVWLIHLTDKNGLVSIEGYAHSNYDLVGYVQNLKGSKHISDVMLVESKRVEVDKISVYNFKLTLRIKV